MSFGYIGNVGVERGRGAYDDRSWSVFVKSSDGCERVGSYATARLDQLAEDLDDKLIPAVQRILDTKK